MRTVEKPLRPGCSNMLPSMPPVAASYFRPMADAKETLAKLNEMGFPHPPQVSATVRRWLAGVPRGPQRKYRTVQFAALAPLLIDRLAGGRKPGRGALPHSIGFLANLHGGARLFSLLRAEPRSRGARGAPARHRATARRYARPASPGARSVDRSGIFRHFAGPRTIGAQPRGFARRGAFPMRSSSTACACSARSKMFLIGARILSGTVSARAGREAFAGASPTPSCARFTTQSPAVTLRGSFMATCRAARPRCSPWQARRSRDDGGIPISI